MTSGTGQTHATPLQHLQWAPSATRLLQACPSKPVLPALATSEEKRNVCFQIYILRAAPAPAVGGSAGSREIQGLPTRGGSQDLHPGIPAATARPDGAALPGCSRQTPSLSLLLLTHSSRNESPQQSPGGQQPAPTGRQQAPHSRLGSQTRMLRAVTMP